MPQPAFNYDLPFDEIDFRARPDLYRVGRGEQGVDLVNAESTQISYEAYRAAKDVPTASS